MGAVCVFSSVMLQSPRFLSEQVEPENYVVKEFIIDFPILILLNFMTSVITFQKFENLEENQNISNNVYWWLQNLDEKSYVHEI